MTRSATRSRTTKETSIELSIDLDGNGSASVATGIPFYDHMLEQLGKHGGF
ncbi:MAG: imidazoleglycerol-phosphate dehydratase, partial [Ilumatobacteraceae bacterium]